MRPLPRIVAPLVVLALVLPTGGCFELLTEVRFAADGSVVQHIRYGLGDEGMRRVSQAVLAAPVPGRRAFRPTDLFERAAVRDELETCGASLAAFETWEDGALRRAQIEAHFTDHDGLAGSPLLGTRTEWFYLRGKAGQVRLVCYPLGREAWRKARFEAHRLETEGDTMQQAVLEARLRELAKLEVKFGIAVPGRVVAATRGMQVAAHRRGVVATIGADGVETPSELVEAMAPRWEVVFEPEGELTGWKLAETEPR